jgi:oligopeptide/dipeptide ABC transporter ATP-binding protein
MAVKYMGAIVEIGPADDVDFEPKPPYTEVLVSSNPEPDPRAERERATSPIRGEITSPINIRPGCRFAGRCPMVMDQCRNVTPKLLAISTVDGKTRQVACHLYNEPAGSNG